MAGTGSKILIGCGIGCLAVIIIIAAIGFTGFSIVRNMVEKFQDMEIAMEDVYDEFGRVEDFTPEPDGSIRPERLRAFIAVRETTTPARRKLDRSLLRLSDAERHEDEIGPLEGLSLIRTVAGVLPKVAEFYNSRNLAMLDEDLGPGEYFYIYILAYHSWLDHPVDDGPAFELAESDIEFNTDSRNDFEIRQRDIYELYDAIQDITLPIMRNQLDAIPAGAEHDPWRNMLADEIEAMERDDTRLPWQEGLPAVIQASLRPYREELEATYSEMCNALELGPDTR